MWISPNKNKNDFMDKTKMKKIISSMLAVPILATYLSSVSPVKASDVGQEEVKIKISRLQQPSIQEMEDIADQTTGNEKGLGFIEDKMGSNVKIRLKRMSLQEYENYLRSKNHKVIMNRDNISVEKDNYGDGKLDLLDIGSKTFKSLGNDFARLKKKMGDNNLGIRDNSLYYDIKGNQPETMAVGFSPQKTSMVAEYTKSYNGNKDLALKVRVGKENTSLELSKTIKIK